MLEYCRQVGGTHGQRRGQWSVGPSWGEVALDEARPEKGRVQGGETIWGAWGSSGSVSSEEARRSQGRTYSEILGGGKNCKNVD